MKRFSLVVMLASLMCLAGCSSFPSLSSLSLPWRTPKAEVPVEPVKPKKTDVSGERVTIQDEEGSVEVQKVEFRSGVSSATVERLARRFGCTGSTGAGLVTDKGPVEVYRMKCDNGTTFMAQCELRQCRPMR